MNMKSLSIVLLFLFGFSTSVFAQNSLIDSLSALVDVSIEDSTQAELQNDIAFELVNLSLYNEAKIHYRKLLELSETVNYKKGVWAYWSGMATILLYENKLDEALSSYLELEKLLQKEGASEVNLGVLYASIANVYDAKSLYNNSVEYHTRALEIFKTLENKEYEAIVLGNLGSVYFKSKDYESAILFHEQSIEIKKEFSSDYSIGTGYFNYAQVYDRLKDYQKTIDVLNESIFYLEKCNDKGGLALCYTSLGLCYVSLSDSLGDKTVSLSTKEGDLLLSKDELLSKALDYEMKAVSIFESLEDKYQIGHAYNGLGTVLINQNNPLMAIKYYTKSYEMFKSTKLETARLAAEGLSEGYKDLNRYKLAYYWHKEMVRLQKEIDDNTNQIELGKQQANLIYSQEKEIKKLQHEKELTLANIGFLEREKELKSERDSRNKFIALIGGLLLIVILVLFFVRKNLSAKNALLLEEEKVKATKIELLEVEKKQTALISSIEGEEKERERIALELHDGVASALTGLRLKLTNDNISGVELEDNLKNINEEIRSISHQLSLPTLQEVDIAELFFEQLISNAFSTEEVNLSCFPEKDKLPLKAQDKKNLYRVIQELFQNITKHAQASEVSVSYTHAENEINIIIEDNGLGFSVKDEKKGIGFDNVKKRLLSLNGELTLDSSPGRGTCVIIQIKKV